MSKLLQKEMLCLSIHKHASNPYIKFEIESYYDYAYRCPCTTAGLNIFDNKILLRDKEFKEDLGFKLTSHLFVNNSQLVWRGGSGCLQIYPHFRNGKAVVAIGLQRYLSDKARRYCFDFPLNTLDTKILWGDPQLSLILAERVLEHLPISQELCVQKDVGGM